MIMLAKSLAISSSILPAPKDSLVTVFFTDRVGTKHEVDLEPWQAKQLGRWLDLASEQTVKRHRIPRPTKRTASGRRTR
jgi:hypothetical protein